MPEYIGHGSWVKATVIVPPTTQDRIVLHRELGKRARCLPRKMPGMDLLTHIRQRLTTDSGEEAREAEPCPRQSGSRPERKAEERKLRGRIIRSPVAVPTIGDPSLVRVKLKPTDRKTLGQSLLDPLGHLLVRVLPASVHDGHRRGLILFPRTDVRVKGGRCGEVEGRHQGAATGGIATA